MKKMTKGAIVTGLGVALLLGGGGTLATWNMDQSASAGTIQSGELSLDVTNKTPWTSSITNGTVSTGHKIIPGEVLTYNQTVQVKKQGEGLKASLNVIGMNQIVPGGTGLNSFGNTLAPTITVTAPNGTTTTLEGHSLYNSSSYTLDADAKAGTYTIKATVAFNAKDQQAMNAAVNLNSIKFQLQQNAVATR